MKKYLLTFCILLLCSNVFAWDNKATHRDISLKAASLSLSVEQLNKEVEYDGIKLQIFKLIQYGAELEDTGSIKSLNTARFRNHFHNPLGTLTLPSGVRTDGGLTDLFTGQSTLFWAQDGVNQFNHDRGDWSWNTIRDYYYQSLTSTNSTNMDMFTAKTYQGLGYQMHLVQDMGQPDHVRNDAHPIDGTGKFNLFETWAKSERALIMNYTKTATKPTVDLTQPLYDGYSPVGRLMDTRRYVTDKTPSAAMNQGLAEYTNANFFSDDTIFAARYSVDDKHYFPYPRREGTDIQKYFDDTKLPETVISEDGEEVEGLWISKTGEGEKVPHLVRVGAAAEFANFVFGEGNRFYSVLGRDEITYADYARLLIPRAVGYSAALLDYFFRGKLDVQPTTSNDTLRYIGVKVTNITNTGEEMTSGKLTLVAKFRLKAETNSTVYSPAPDAPYYYRVVTLPTNVAIPRDSGAEYIFDLAENPLPLLATEITLQVVYWGSIGYEAGAVAVGNAPMNYLTSDIALSLPHNGVYAVADPAENGFSKISLTAKYEAALALPNAQFKLRIRYRRSITDPFQNVRVDTLPSDAGAYYVIEALEANGVNSLQPNTPQELTFNLPTPLPFWASDVYLEVIYQNPYDPNEDNITWGFLDISEPTPVDIFNNTDYVCINNQWYSSGSPEAYEAIGVDPYTGLPLDDIFSHSLDTVTLWAQAVGMLKLPVDTSMKTLQGYNVLPGQFKRIGYILTNYEFERTLAGDVSGVDPRDPWYHWFDPDEIWTGSGFANQKDKNISIMDTIRSYNQWRGAGFTLVNEDQSLPDKQCNLDTLQ